MYLLHVLGELDLRDESGASVQSVLVQPKRLALLVYLALAEPRGFHRRDRLTALFWPESDQEHARASLRKTVHYLRRSLGEDIVRGRGDAELALGPGVLRCDAVEMEQLICAGRPEEALASYGGDLLPGFYVSDAPEVDRWIEEERARLRQLAASACWEAVSERDRKGDPAAVELARRARALNPDDEVGLRRLLSMLIARSDQSGALQEFERFAAWLRHEYDAEPAAETVALVARIRSGQDARGTPSPATVAAPAPEVPPPPQIPHPGSAIDRDRPPRWLVGLGLVTAFLIPAVIQSFDMPRAGPGEDRPIVAVGRIVDLTGRDEPGSTAAIRTMLSAQLARLQSTRVIGADRVLTLTLAMGGDTSGLALAQAATEAGAVDLLEGAVYELPDRQLRLELTRVELATGIARDSYMAEGSDMFDLVSNAVRVIARRHGETPPVGPSPEGHRPVAAYRLYEEGQRALYVGDLETANRLFAAALAEDSTFTMAAFHEAQTYQRGAEGYQERFRKVLRLAERASEPERLLVQGTWAFVTEDPARLAIAETLAVRYPMEVEGHHLLGRARLWDGDFDGAVWELERAVAMDSLSLGQSQSRCSTACLALAELVIAHVFADSLAAAERVARRWVERDPGSMHAVHRLRTVLEFAGRFDEALAIHRREMEIAGSRAASDPARAMLEIRRGGFPEADARLRFLIDLGTESSLGTGLWWQTVSYRYQGRHAEALRTIERLRAVAKDPDDLALRFHHAQVLHESGRLAPALALLDSAAERLARSGLPPGVQARHASWLLTHRATTLAALGDTASLVAIRDSLKVLGPRSAYGRDRLLQHHVDGLLWQARGDPETAAIAFRKAIFSPVAGYTRSNLELARTLMACGRSEEAIAPLRSALRGGLESSGLYATHTELRELLGKAYEGAGEPDSAAAQYRRVLGAWSSADRLLVPRREEVRRRLAHLLAMEP